MEHEPQDLGDTVGEVADAVEEKINNASAAFHDAVQEGFGSPTPPSPPVPAKVLDFGIKPVDPTTPSTPFVEGKDDEGDYEKFILDTLLWKNKIRSTVYAVGGVLLLLLSRYIVSSESSLISALGYFLLSALAFNFTRSIVNKAWQEGAKWAGSGTTHYAVSTAAASIQAAAVLADKYLGGVEPIKTLQVSLVLWAVALLGRVISGLDLLLVLYVAAFTLPLAYTHKKAKVDAVLTDAYAKAKGKYSALDRKGKAAFLAVPVLLIIALSHRDRYVAIFLFLVYGRLLLKPSEVDGLQRKVIAPATKGVASAYNTLTKTAAQVADKYELTPTPSKKKAA